MMDYLKNDHLRHCLPHSVPSGMSSLPVDYIYEDGVRTSTRTTKKLPLTGQPLDGRTTYVNTLPYFTTSDITPDEINKIGEDGLKALYPQVNNERIVNKAWTMLRCTQWTMLCCTQWTMLSTRLFSHDNNVVTASFNHQYCYNLLTRLSNNDNNNEQACSINIVFSCFNNREQPLLLHQCWTTLLKQ